MISSDLSRRFQAALERIDSSSCHKVQGKVTRIIGSVVEATSLDIPIGCLCHIKSASILNLVAEVVGFHERGVMLMPLGDLDGVHPGAMVTPLDRPAEVGVGSRLMGRVLDGLGRPLDGREPPLTEASYPLNARPPSPLTRKAIDRPLSTGVRVLDGLLTIGRGQRIGLFAGSGVGKSVLLGMMARNTDADVNVIALLGERGREVKEFIERDLGPEGLRRSVVVVATSDEAPLIRAKGGLVATAIAEYFRDQGKDVLLMVDSITRVATAWREIGLSIGEPPTTRGYPPSVFSQLPRLLERAGTNDRGSITAFYNVLVEGDDFNEPVADAARGVLDGHVVLSRQLASKRHYPAVDVLQSVSRVRDAVIDDVHKNSADAIIKLEAAYRDAEDLISVGAYKQGSNPLVDTAVNLRTDVLGFLQQDAFENSTFQATCDALGQLTSPIG